MSSLNFKNTFFHFYDKKNTQLFSLNIAHVGWYDVNVYNLPLTFIIIEKEINL